MLHNLVSEKILGTRKLAPVSGACVAIWHRFFSVIKLVSRSEQWRKWLTVRRCWWSEGEAVCRSDSAPMLSSFCGSCSTQRTSYCSRGRSSVTLTPQPITTWQEDPCRQPRSRQRTTSARSWTTPTTGRRTCYELLTDDRTRTTLQHMYTSTL